jgi:hypothetical protein
MPTWSGILEQLTKLGDDPAKYDTIRRTYLTKMYTLTGRNVIVYATKWTQGDAPPGVTSITNEDLSGLMEVVYGLAGPNLDLILHSPGGSPAAAEALVKYIRSKFDDVRVIVPQMAMSAATMIACSANRIVMGKHSFLGPIDPQFLLPTGIGDSRRFVPADTVKKEFDLAVQECSDPKKVGAWMWKIQQYGPGLLIECDNMIALSKLLVKEWLEAYMFKGEVDAAMKAERIGDWLGSHDEFKTHARPLDRDSLAAQGLKIENMEANQEEQDAFLTVFHTFMHTFNGTGAVKIIENHLGKAYLKQVQQVRMMPMQLPLQLPSGLPPSAIPVPVSAPAPAPAPAPTRAKSKPDGKASKRKGKRSRS